MWKFRILNVVDCCLVMELKEVKECVGVNINLILLKCFFMIYVFVYGILKKGFLNYWFMEDVCFKGYVWFLGFVRMKEMFFMVCGFY